MTALRRIVDDEHLLTPHLDDYQVLEQIAAMVACRALCLIVPVPRSVSVQTGSPKVVPPSTGLTPSQYTHRPTDSEPISRVQEIEDLAEIVDQDRQAAALEAAARDGVPFCEVCEKARQQQAATGAGAA
jgi:hypothetical protein